MDDILTSVSSANGLRDWTQEWLDSHPHSSSGPSETLDNNDDENQDFATRLYTLCLRLLLFLCQREQSIPSKRYHVASLKEELGKLYLWGEAFSSGKLDRALEYSDDVRCNVLDSLGDIGKILLRELWPSSTSKVSGGSLQKSIHELKSLVEQTKNITSTRDHARKLDDSDWADESDTDEGNPSDDEDTTNTVDELRLQTQWLTQLGPILEQNLVSAQKPCIQASIPAPVPFSVSGPAKVYVSLVREKYKLAQDQLVERLGEANWQRHISVRNSMEAEVTTAPVGSSAVALSIFRPYSTFHDSALGPSIQGQTEYAPSHTSFQSSHTEGERESIRVPATPVEVTNGKPFQCFLCKSILSNIKNRVDWKMHVFADLQPYICTFADCEDELAKFPNRAAWAEHEFSQHRITRSWSCPECPQAFKNLPRWESHTQERHCLSFSDQNLSIAKDMAYKTEATRIEEDECPLCRLVLGKPRRAFVKHVGRHMEEIALMALPRDIEEDSEEGSVSTDRTNTSHSEHIAQQSSSLKSSTPRQYGGIAQHKDDVDPINLGRVDALGPPSQDHPVPAPPLWLGPALGRLKRFYPDDLFEAIMHHTDVSTITDSQIYLANEPITPDTKFMYYPRIKCLDCPGELYKPGPGFSANDFEIHLKNRLHREKVERRKRLVQPNTQKPAPGPQRERLRSPKRRQDALNKFFVNGEGIHRKVLQREICKFLGPEASARPSTYNGCEGYTITAVRPFTSKMIDDLIELSNSYVPETRERINRFQDISYAESETSRSQMMPPIAIDMPTTSSYWSAPEQADFESLVRHFGKDWEAIAATMKTKTATMIANYYSRKIQEDELGERLEKDAEIATAMVANGVYMGPLPVLATREGTTSPKSTVEFVHQRASDFLKARAPMARNH